MAAASESSEADFHADESAWLAAPGAAIPCSTRVLLAEDCPLNQVLASALLSRWGIAPTIVSNGAEAVLMAAQQDFDLILMDIEMPVMNGLFATLAIRRHERDNPHRRRVPVVAYTAGDLASEPDTLQRVGIDGVIQKPCDAGALALCLLRWCAPKAAPVPAVGGG